MPRLRQRQRVQRPAAAGGQQHRGLGHALRRPARPAACAGGGRRQRQALAAAAHGGQQLRRVGGAQQQPGAGRAALPASSAARWPTAGSCASAGCSSSTLARPRERGLDDPVDRRAHLVDADLAAGLALAAVAVGLVVGASASRRSRAAPRAAARSRSGCDARPAPAGSWRSGRRAVAPASAAFAQPGLRQRRAGTPARRRPARRLHQQRMRRAACQRLRAAARPARAAAARRRRRLPWPVRLPAPARICAQHGLARGASASMRTKRAGAALGACRIAGAHALEEGRVLGLEAVGRARRARGAAAAIAGGRSNHSVRSGWRPCCTQASSCASTATSKPRPPPW